MNNKHEGRQAKKPSMGTAWGAPPTPRKHWNKTQEVAHSGTQRKALEWFRG